MKTKLLITAITGILALSLAPSANAQGGFSFSFGKHRRGKHVGFSLNLPFNRRHNHYRMHGHAHAHVHTGACRHWVPGCFEVVNERVWVPGCSRKVWVQPVYRTQYDECGNPVQILVSPGHFDVVQGQGHYEVRSRRVQRAGHWAYACGH